MSDRRIISIFGGIQLTGKWEMMPSVKVSQVSDRFGNGSALSEEYPDEYILKLLEVPVFILKLNNGLGQPNPKLFGRDITLNPEQSLIAGFATETFSFPRAKITNQDYRTLITHQPTEKITLEFHILGNHA